MYKLFLLLMLPSLVHAGVTGQVRVSESEESGALQIDVKQFNPGDGTASNRLTLNQSSVTLLGPTITAADVDLASFTLQGNSFNGSGQLLRFDSGSFTPNVVSTYTFPAGSGGFLIDETSACTKSRRDFKYSVTYSSDPTVGGLGFFSVRTAAARWVGAKNITLQTQCSDVQAVSGGPQVSARLHFRAVGDGTSAGDANRACFAVANSTHVNYNNNLYEVPLTPTGTYEWFCGQVGASGGNANCTVREVGACW